ncbi:hypothetical protein MAR_036995 [Mya arenaria]|uniref:Uncharacterized protein n=1 Tax=Mya arenaria TaxID=6604 RepID=A0ABY7FR00_MYAAR|nr:hypothetical protein MAR_036995 [Mya arenaria]
MMDLTRNNNQRLVYHLRVAAVTIPGFFVLIYG